MQGIIRGIYDTIPAIHTSSSVMFLLDTMQNITGTKKLVSQGQIATESLCLTSETVSKQAELDISTAFNMTTTRRAEQPSVMANLKFGADCGEDTVYKYNNVDRLSSDMKFKFNQRDKFKTYNVIAQEDTEYRGTEIVTDETTQNRAIVTYGANKKEFVFDAYEKTDFIIPWNKLCEAFTVRDSMSMNIKIGTYDPVKGLYSNQLYSKDIIMEVPSIVGIVANKEEAQAYAGGIVKESYVIVPKSDYSISRTILYNLCPMVMLYKVDIIENEDGTVTETPVVGIIKGQDGNMYDLQPICYRIVGKDTEGKALLYEMTIDIEYVLKTYFNTRVNNPTDYYKYNVNGVWEAITVEE